MFTLRFGGGRKGLDILLFPAALLLSAALWLWRKRQKKQAKATRDR